jgi:hypothetical protein
MIEFSFISDVYGSLAGSDAGRPKIKTARKAGGKEQDDFARKRNYDMSIEPLTNPLLTKPVQPIIPPAYEVRPVQYALNGAHGARHGTPAEWQTSPPAPSCVRQCPNCGGCACGADRPRPRRLRRRRASNDLMQRVLMSVAFACFAIYVVEAFVKRSSR